MHLDSYLLILSSLYPYSSLSDYSFQYKVGNNDDSVHYSHGEDRNEDKTVGNYQVLLPDGRTQIVTYNIPDEKTGYVAQVQYQNNNMKVERKREIQKKVYMKPSLTKKRKKNSHFGSHRKMFHGKESDQYHVSQQTLSMVTQMKSTPKEATKSFEKVTIKRPTNFKENSSLQKKNNKTSDVIEYLEPNFDEITNTNNAEFDDDIYIQIYGGIKSSSDATIPIFQAEKFSSEKEKQLNKVKESEELNEKSVSSYPEISTNVLGDLKTIQNYSIQVQTTNIPKQKLSPTPSIENKPEKDSGNQKYNKNFRVNHTVDWDVKQQTSIRTALDKNKLSQTKKNSKSNLSNLIKKNSHKQNYRSKGFGKVHPYVNSIPKSFRDSSQEKHNRRLQHNNKQPVFPQKHEGTHKMYNKVTVRTHMKKDLNKRHDMDKVTIRKKRKLPASKKVGFSYIMCIKTFLKNLLHF